MSELVTIKPRRTAVSVSGSVVIPAAIAVRRFLEFFAATIRNRNTREAYYRAACCSNSTPSASWRTSSRCTSPYIIETLQATAAKPTVKQHLAAIRMLFDWLVVGQVLATNPTHSVRGPKHVVRRGKTPVLTAEEARQLLDSIDTTTLVRPARPRADRRDDLRLRPHRRRRRDARRGLLPRG
jgi:site-specific recombinase XerC